MSLRSPVPWRLQAPFLAHGGAAADVEAAENLAGGLNRAYRDSRDFARFAVTGSSTLAPHTYICRTRSTDYWLWDHMRFVQLGVPLPRDAALAVAKAAIEARSRRSSGGSAWTAEADGKRVITPAAVVRALSAKQPQLTASPTRVASKHRPHTAPYAGLISSAVQSVSDAVHRGSLSLSMSGLAPPQAPAADADPSAAVTSDESPASVPSNQLRSSGALAATAAPAISTDPAAAPPSKAAAVNTAVTALLRQVREATFRDVAVACTLLYSGDRLRIRLFSVAGHSRSAVNFGYYAAKQLVDAIRVPAPTGARLGSGTGLSQADTVTLLPPFADALQALVWNKGWVLLRWTGPATGWRWGTELADTLHFFSDGRFFQQRKAAQRISAAVLAVLAKAVCGAAPASLPAGAQGAQQPDAAGGAQTAPPASPGRTMTRKPAKSSTAAECMSLADWAALPAVQALLHTIKAQPADGDANDAAAATTEDAGRASPVAAPTAAAAHSCAMEFEQHLAAEAAARAAGLPVPEATQVYLQKLGFHMLRWLWAADRNADAFVPSRDTPLTRAGLNFCSVQRMAEAAIEAWTKHWERTADSHPDMAQRWDESGVPALPRVARSDYSEAQVADPEFAAALEHRLRKSPW